MPAHSTLHKPFGRSRAADLAFLLLAWSLALILLQWVLRMAHHGADLTDEGFSFNSISHPWLYTSTLSQFGFVYHPLYEAIGQDLIGLRQAGMLISYALAMAVAALYLFRMHAGQTGWRLRHPLVVRVGKGVGLFSVHSIRFGVHTDMRFLPEVPLVSPPGLVHPRVHFAAAVLGRALCENQGGIHYCPAPVQQALGWQHRVDRGQYLRAQLLGFEQVAESQDGALDRQVLQPLIEMREFTEHERVDQRFLHRRAERLNHCCTKWMRSMLSTAKGRHPHLDTAQWCVRGDSTHQPNPGVD